MNNQSSEASPLTADTDEELLNAIVQEMALLPRLYRRILRESGENSLYTPKFWALGMLACEGPMSMSALARRMQVTKQYITALVDRMVEEGLAIRRPDQNDRRIINLCITEAGNGTLQDVKARARQEIRTTLSQLEVADRRRLHRALQEQKEILFMLEEPR
jgi:DNA-binding MarR family transcriptional regulator